MNKLTRLESILICNAAYGWQYKLNTVAKPPLPEQIAVIWCHVQQVVRSGTTSIHFAQKLAPVTVSASARLHAI